MPKLVVKIQVPGVHCEVRMRGEELQIRDMRSTNGTFIGNGLIADGIIKLEGAKR